MNKFQQRGKTLLLTLLNIPVFPSEDPFSLLLHYASPSEECSKRWFKKAGASGFLRGQGLCKGTVLM